MHLAHPSFTTSGKSKMKSKFRTAEDAQKSRQADLDWKALQKKWSVDGENKKQTRALAALTYSPGPLSYRGSDQPKIPSLASDWGNCTKAPDRVYTGTKMIGIGQLHKSNAVPVFSKEDAVAISQMRRG
jgi:hypothetical protein